MCGIAGYVGISACYGREVLERMAAVQAHRGPDGDGFFLSGLTGLSHRRLAVLDRAGGGQPMTSPDGRYVLVYNGEVYNFRELRASLEAAGRTFTSTGDTEVVLAAWEAWGTAAFDRFDGMFALAVADTVTGEVVLARDQFGIKPLYLATDGDGRVAFASEIRPVLAAGIVPRRPDDRTIYRYLRFRVHDDTEHTFFAGVTRLLPGQAAVISPDGSVRRWTYTSLYSSLRRLAASPRPYDGPSFAAGLAAAIRSRLVSDVPVGTALSGGLDSSTVVTSISAALSASDEAAAAIGPRQHTFSAVFPGQPNDEERYVDAVARRCDRLEVHKVRPDPDRFLVDLLDFVRTQEEPVISTGPYAQFCVMREASRYVTVMLDGQGADEMLAGYLPYYLVHLRQVRRRHGLPALLAELVRSRDVLWRLGRHRVFDRLRRRRSIPVTRFLAGEFASAHSGERLDIVRDDLKARLEDDLFRHSLPALLRYEDRNTMRFSVEGRVPFLDADLLKTLWAQDDTAILYRGWNKRALRDATVDLLPPLVHRRRNKIGFTTPEDSWFQRIKNDVHLIFASDSFGARPYFDQPAVLAAFSAYLAGRVSADTMTFWRLLNVELWLREFIDREPVAPLAAGSSVGDAGPGVHPQAPPKSDYVANEGKELVLGSGGAAVSDGPPGGGWARFPLRVDLVAPGDDVPALAAAAVTRFFAGLPDAPVDVAELAIDRRWYLYVSEKVVAVAQGRVFFTWDIHPGRWAGLLSRYVSRTPYGIGLGHPTTMQLAIDEAGLPRILLAAAAGLAGKALGRRGLFYRVAGPAVRAIDGPTEYSAYPANVSAKLAPADPYGVARRISAALRGALPTPVAAGFAGTVVIDANDLGRNVLGHDTDLPEPVLENAFADNPLGQAREQTPFAVVAAQPAVTGCERTFTSR
jgi:asparagine synthase (glutamine-hydrolysing)